MENWWPMVLTHDPSSGDQERKVYVNLDHVETIEPYRDGMVLEFRDGTRRQYRFNRKLVAAIGMDFP